MKSNIKELQEFIISLESYRLPDYKELPDIALYMEQVVSYVSQTINPIVKTSEKEMITPFMINNYVKAKMISAPIEKKYNKDHLGYLIVISLLKSTCSLKDLSSFIALDKMNKVEKQKLYNLTKLIKEEVIKAEAHKVKVKIDTLLKSKTKTSTSELDQALGALALKLYIESETSKLIADEIMKFVGNDVLTSKQLDSFNKVKKKEVKKINKDVKKNKY